MIEIGKEHTIQQKSSMRYLDAHEVDDHGVVTRSDQGDRTQLWRFDKLGYVFTMKQVSTGRYLDAHEFSNADYSVVTRKSQKNDSQIWLIYFTGSESTYRIKQLSSGRFLDAHERSNMDFSAVTRQFQNNDSQLWLFRSAFGSNWTDGGAIIIRMKQLVTQRLLDAHEHSNMDFSVVTRQPQNNDSQLWSCDHLGDIYTITQSSSNRALDAQDDPGRDHGVFTTNATIVGTNEFSDRSKEWLILPDSDDSYSIRQVSGGRFLDAYESAVKDYAAKTRNNLVADNQRWIIRPVDN